MNEIKCPKCGTIFQIAETDYESIARQIRDTEFTKELTARQKDFETASKNASLLAEANLKKTYEARLSAKEIEITKLNSELKAKEEQATHKLEQTYKDELNTKTLTIANLENALKQKETEAKLALKDALFTKEQEINNLQNKIEANKNEFFLKEKNLKENYEEKIKVRDEQISYYRDLKARQSTKMVGESLEVHCSNEFNKLRPLFPNAYFEKDNDAKTGSKGDFIFRDYDAEGTELVSIMFEMKNELDATATKHKNEDFFKELDKDRHEKNCEYAVLVSLLENDNDYYNQGIVDVSHKYAKMYVIRPQFFIPLITLIRNISLNSLAYKKELQTIHNQNFDIAHFEDNMNAFKESFARNYRLASDKFKKAIEEIDKTIDHLGKIKDALISSENNLRLANNKAEDLSIKKLTHNNPTMAHLFTELKEEDEKVSN